MPLSSKYFSQVLASRGVPAATSLTHRQQYIKLVLSRRATELVFVLLLQSLNLLFDYLLVWHSPLAFGAAVNLILVFWRGYWVLPGLIIGGLAFAGYEQATLAQAALFALANGLLPVAIVCITRRLIGPLLPFASNKDWFAFVGLSCCLSLLFAPLFLIGLGRATASGDMLGLASRYALGYILLTPANLIWGSYPFIHKLLGRKQWLEIAAACAVLAVWLVVATIVAPLAFWTFAVAGGLIFVMLGARIGLYGVAILSLTISIAVIILALCQKQLGVSLPPPQLLAPVLLILANLGYPLAIKRAAKRQFRV